MNSLHWIGIGFDAGERSRHHLLAGLSEFARTQPDWRLRFLGYDPDPVSCRGLAGLVRGPRFEPVGLKVPTVHLSLDRKPCVVEDSAAVGRMAAAHLLQCGYSTLAAFGSEDLRDYVRSTRMAAFEEAVAAAGRPLHRFRWDSSRPWSLRAAGVALDAWLRRVPRPMALATCSVDHLLRVLEGVDRLGLRCPDEVALLSMGEDSLVLPNLTPPISAVVMNQRQIGWEVGRCLARVLSGTRAVAEIVRIGPSHIEERASTDRASSRLGDLAPVVRHIWAHVEEQIHVADLVAKFPFSERTLYNRFTARLGRSPLDEIRISRLETARRLLVTTRIPLAEVALRSGYASQSQMNRAIREATGDTPGNLRANQHPPD